MDYFDSIFCINLDRRTDRWAEAQAEILTCGLDRCQRVSAAVSSINSIVGCSASHRALWRRIASGSCGSRALIFEDDFMLVTRDDLLNVGYANSDALRLFDSCQGTTLSERFSEIEPYIPARWDLLYLGGSYETQPRERVNRYIIRNAGMHCTHAYAISSHYATRLTAYLDSFFAPETHNTDVQSGAADSVLASQAKSEDVYSYTFAPRLFIQRPTSPSDINPQPPGGFPHSMVDSAHEMSVTPSFSRTHG